jgi:uncharacterized membrane protein YdfJ with MMPL/SSD domain
MPVWMEWVARHWLAIVLIAGAIWAITYVCVKHKQLFYKE